MSLPLLLPQQPQQRAFRLPLRTQPALDQRSVETTLPAASHPRRPSSPRRGPLCTPSHRWATIRTVTKLTWAQTRGTCAHGWSPCPEPCLSTATRGTAGTTGSNPTSIRTHTEPASASVQADGPIRIICTAHPLTRETRRNTIPPPPNRSSWLQGSIKTRSRSWTRVSSSSFPSSAVGGWAPWGSHCV